MCKFNIATLKTSIVAETPVKVAMDVVEHKKGNEAGQVVNYAGTDTGNVLRTAMHIAPITMEEVVVVLPDCGCSTTTGTCCT